MTIQDVINHFQTLSNACRSIDIKPQNMTKWKSQGYIPLKQQFLFAQITEGELMPDEVDPCPKKNTGPKKTKRKGK